MTLHLDSVSGLDCLRDGRMAAAERIERVIGLSRHLAQSDRQLVWAVLRHGQSIAGLAQLMGTPRLRIQRRFSRLLARMASRPYRLADRHLGELTAAEQMLARRRIFADQPVRKLAAELGISLHQARKELAALAAKLARLQHEALCSRAPAASGQAGPAQPGAGHRKGGHRKGEAYIFQPGQPSK